MKTSLPARVMLTNLPTQLNLEYMLRWSIIFFVIAIIAAIFGFGGIAEGAASIAKVLFFIFLALFIIAILFGATLFKK
jgi:uncharacterized membrane protein YtjA (UPF0391 family)